MNNINQPLNNFSFPEEELKILHWWQENQIFQKSLVQNKESKPYIFYDGPPFATGLPHHGHLVGSTLKDIIPRYFTMKGYYVQRRFGWDCHGLPIEHEIDKALKMSSHDAVKKLGIAGYNNQCRAIVQKYTSQWRETINRIGRWVDFENDYKTMDVTFMESVWWVFQQLWNKGLIYQSTKVMPFSTALETVLSNFEAGSNYQMVQDPAISVLFKLNDSDEYLCAWTTTPWTLPSNLGLCVNQNITYLKVKDQKQRVLIIAKDRFEYYQKKLNLEQIEEISGSQLVGKKYTPLFNFFQQLSKEGAFQVHHDDYVSTESGTGIVHLAPSFGEDDERVIKANQVTANVCPVDSRGRFTEEVGPYQGQYVKDADKKIIHDLKESGALLEQSTIDHSYPLCPRSQTPLIYKAIPSWYVNVESIKSDLLAANEQIHWVPEHLKKGRFGNWLAGARDWAISRNRIWGTPIPLWYNSETEKYICIGSREELEKYTGKKLNDLHREFVDELEFEIPGEEGRYRRVSEVLDCWFESGSMPYAQLHYPFENKDLFQKAFPAEFIAEGLDQTRGWFYTLTILSAALHQKPAFKNVIVNGLVLAADGKKMSKSLRNYTAPDELMKNYGADALRIFLINSGLVRGEDLKFSDEGVKEMVRKVLLPWYNSFRFFYTYTQTDQWQTEEKSLQEAPKHILDQWILSELQTLTNTVNQQMQQYKLYNVIPALFRFIDQLTNWYIRLNRKRFWSEGNVNNQDKMQAYRTLYQTLEKLSLLMAPFTPFLSETLYLQLKGLRKDCEKMPQSVHLCTFPEESHATVNPKLEKAVHLMQQVILLGRQKRVQEQVKVKIPLPKLKIIHRDSSFLELIKDLEENIKIELNVKEIEYDTAEFNYIKLYAKPNSPLLGKKFGKKFRDIAKGVQSLNSEQLKEFETNKELSIEGETISLDEVFIYRDPLPNTQAMANADITIDLNCQLDQQLINEGMAREVINRIQKTRKEDDLNVSERISIVIHTSPELQQVIEDFWSLISKETLALSFSFSNKKQQHQLEIDDQPFEISITVK